MINGHICAAQNTTGLSAAIFLTHGPTGWELHNKSVKLLMLILNCCSVCVCVALRMQCVRMHVCYVASQTQWDRERSVLQRVASVTFMAPSSFLRAVFWKKGIISSLMPVWTWLALFSAIKNELFLAHCVKTWASQPVHVCAHWNNFPSPEGLSGLFSYMCWSSICRASHYMQTRLRNAVWLPWGHQAWMAVSFTNHSPSYRAFLSSFCLSSNPLPPQTHTHIFLFLLVHHCCCILLIAAGMQHGSPQEVWRQGSGRRGWYVLCCQWAVCLLGLILVQSTGLYFQDLFGTWMVRSITLIAWSTMSHSDLSRFSRALNEMLSPDDCKVKMIILGWYFH